MLGTLVQELQQTEEGRLRRFFLRRFRNRADAADATQETFLRLLASAQRSLIENPQAYLFQTARNIAFDQERQQKRRAQVECPITDEKAVLNVPCDAPSAEMALIDKERLHLFEQALIGLPERARKVIVLRRTEGWSYPVIAEHLGVSPNTVYNDLRLAMAHCMTAIAGPDRT
ncbi:FecI-like protein [Nitrobacter sp. Nb-311A]|uniref:RNA polymerase sigma factor n=1 Tax=unclassified Nitrobacter TaxID=2620411 RepID=UPI0000686329|nr:MULTISPECIES: sigma-70 family RNA polymerase sigma factor [unclassified Nitrobacter]EAQ37609.1 FecI-like protein [Nitrobacter sp. Nb-311A]MCV0386457.1 sigma-70 family RNA polymerase sigma factor [Nitrobacter sp.]